MRTGRDNRGDWYQIYLDEPWGDSNEIFSFGDDIIGESIIFFHEGDCSEGGFMEFVVDQVHLNKEKKLRILSSGSEMMDKNTDDF